jgi:hypothetical protein
MKNDVLYNWIERMFSKFPINYVYLSIIIILLLYCIFFTFSKYVKIFKLNDIYYNIEIMTMCMLVGYEMAGISYLSINIRNTFIHISLDNGILSDAYRVLKKRLTKSYWYYALIALVMLPLLAIDYRLLLRGDLGLFSVWSDKFAYIMLDIYNFFFNLSNRFSYWNHPMDIIKYIIYHLRDGRGKIFIAFRDHILRL